MDNQYNNSSSSFVSKKDYFLVAIIGFVSGLLILPIVKNINFNLTTIRGVVMVIALTVLAVIALWVAKIISGKIPMILQIAKFVATGVLNTLLDIGVLNLLMFVFVATSGSSYSIFKGASFIVANINSYFWNKHWTFGTFGSGKSATTKEFGQFFAVSFVGFLINIGIASLVVNFISPVGGISVTLWANVGAIVATLASLVWNFLGYKFIVFKKLQPIAA
ncbi:MAG: GtrA family protein [Patescibacteria group bacterium]